MKKLKMIITKNPLFCGIIIFLFGAILLLFMNNAYATLGTAITLLSLIAIVSYSYSLGEMAAREEQEKKR